MRAWRIVAVVLVAGCGSGGGALSSSSGTASPSGGSISSSTTPAPSTSPQSSCDLPVAGFGVGQQTGVNNRFLTAFVRVPGGTETVDPAGEVVQTGSSSNVHWRTVTQPYLYSWTAAATYSASTRRWVPVAPSAVSPDGSRYAYAEIVVDSAGRPGPTPIHVVDIASAADRVVSSQGQYDVLRYGSDGVYLVHHVVGTDSSSGLWLLDPATGALRQIRAAEQSVEWYVIGGGAAWSGALDPSDPHPAPAKFPHDEVVRLDLASGAESTWFRQLGSQVTVVGFDPDGHPLVESSTADATSLWLVSGPTTQRQLYTSAAPGRHVTSAVTSSDRTWLTTETSLFVFTRDSGVTELSAPGVVNANVELAGDCTPTR